MPRDDACPSGGTRGPIAHEEDGTETPGSRTSLQELSPAGADGDGARFLERTRRRVLVAVGTMLTTSSAGCSVSIEDGGISIDFGGDKTPTSTSTPTSTPTDHGYGGTPAGTATTNTRTGAPTATDAAQSTTDTAVPSETRSTSAPADDYGTQGYGQYGYGG